MEWHAPATVFGRNWYSLPECSQFGDLRMRRFSLLVLALSVSFVGCKPPAEEKVVPKASKPKSSVVTEDAGASAPAAAPAADDKKAPAEGTTPAATPTEPAAPTTPPAEGTDPKASTDGGAAVRFVADKKLEVPAMMCPYGCYPTVEKALATVPGVKGVQLAKQPAGTPEGEIALKVVELQLSEGFDLNAAIAALKKASFDASEAN